MLRFGTSDAEYPRWEPRSDWIFEVLGALQSGQSVMTGYTGPHTFEMKQHVRLVILEHLSHKLDVHVLYVDLLETSVHDHHRLVELLLCRL